MTVESSTETVIRARQGCQISTSRFNSSKTRIISKNYTDVRHPVGFIWSKKYGTRIKYIIF